MQINTAEEITSDPKNELPPQTTLRIERLKDMGIQVIHFPWSGTGAEVHETIDKIVPEMISDNKYKHKIIWGDLRHLEQGVIKTIGSNLKAFGRLVTSMEANRVGGQVLMGNFMLYMSLKASGMATHDHPMLLNTNNAFIRGIKYYETTLLDPSLPIGGIPNQYHPHINHIYNTADALTIFDTYMDGILNGPSVIARLREKEEREKKQSEEQEMKDIQTLINKGGRNGEA